MSVVRKVFDDYPNEVVFATAAAVRILLALAFPELPDILTGRVEISTPVSSFKRLHEGLFLYQRGLDPYDGGIFYQAPLFLSLFSFVPSPTPWVGRFLSVLLFTSIDLFSARCLLRIAESKAATICFNYESPRQMRSWRPLSVAAIYLFNPYTTLACLGRPTSAFAVAFVLLSIDHACQAKSLTSAFALATAAYVSVHPALLLPPIGLLCYERLCYRQSCVHGTKRTGVAPDHHPGPAAVLFASRFIGVFFSGLAFLLVLSRLIISSWQFLPSVYLTPLQLPDLTPNVGLWWYFFIEMFDPFRSFFLGVFWLHMLSYSAPLCLRLKNQPLAAVILMMGVVAIFEPYANAGDIGAWLSALCLLSHVFELSAANRYPFFSLAAVFYCTLLGPAFHHLWIYSGSGNANFFYAITLTWNLAHLIVLTDTLYSVLRDEWERERPEGKLKEVKQI